MGTCLSTTKVSGSNSNNTTTTTTTTTTNKPSSKTIITSKHEEASHYEQKTRKNQQQQHQAMRINNNSNNKTNSRRQSGVIPCGKRTDFGYAKDFGKRYTIGKLLGHGQFGYTYVGIDINNGDRVAVKRIEKNKELEEEIDGLILEALSLGCKLKADVSKKIFNSIRVRSRH